MGRGQVVMHLRTSMPPHHPHWYLNGSEYHALSSIITALFEIFSILQRLIDSIVGFMEAFEPVDE